MYKTLALSAVSALAEGARLYYGGYGGGYYNAQTSYHPLYSNQSYNTGSSSQAAIPSELLASGIQQLPSWWNGDGDVFLW